VTEISAPQFPKRYNPNRSVNVLNRVIHQNVRPPQVIVPDFLDSGLQPVLFSKMDYVESRETFDLVEKFTDWERFHSLTSKLVSLRLQINISERADKVVFDFTASVAAAYWFPKKNTVSESNFHVTGLDCLLKHKERISRL
jgi:hypothetical protein